jgi:2-dehydro-3-deoxyphosphooctonate aldolase (KDO 8-P synthase)
MTDAATLLAGEGFLLIAGPCVLEDAALNLRVAQEVLRVAEATGVRALFKASFDKANRTSLDSARGPGLAAGLDALRRVRESVGLPVLTDVHESAQVEEVASVVDVLQIPAFLCRQTDLLLAAGSSGRAVNIKKGQWMAPEDMRHPVEKVRAAGGADVAVTERGTAFGYGRWVVDMRGFAVMSEACACPVLYDATHSIQLPAAGAGGSASGGEPRHIPALARAAVAAGADGMFIEVHPDPVSAPSDGANMLPLDRLEGLVANLLEVRAAAQRGETARV